VQAQVLRRVQKQKGYIERFVWPSLILAPVTGNWYKIYRAEKLT
jgi:hypothetical protein